MIFQEEINLTKIMHRETECQGPPIFSLVGYYSYVIDYCAKQRLPSTAFLDGDLAGSKYPISVAEANPLPVFLSLIALSRFVMEISAKHLQRLIVQCSSEDVEGSAANSKPE